MQHTFIQERYPFIFTKSFKNLTLASLFEKYEKSNPFIWQVTFTSPHHLYDTVDNVTLLVRLEDGNNSNEYVDFEASIGQLNRVDPRICETLVQYIAETKSFATEEIPLRLLRLTKSYYTKNDIVVYSQAINGLSQQGKQNFKYYSQLLLAKRQDPTLRKVDQLDFIEFDEMMQSIFLLTYHYRSSKLKPIASSLTTPLSDYSSQIDLCVIQETLAEFFAVALSPFIRECSEFSSEDIASILKPSIAASIFSNASQKCTVTTDSKMFKSKQKCLLIFLKVHPAQSEPDRAAQKFMSMQDNADSTNDSLPSSHKLLTIRENEISPQGYYGIIPSRVAQILIAFDQMREKTEFHSTMRYITTIDDQYHVLMVESSQLAIETIVKSCVQLLQDYPQEIKHAQGITRKECPQVVMITYNSLACHSSEHILQHFARRNDSFFENLQQQDDTSQTPMRDKSGSSRNKRKTPAQKFTPPCNKGQESDDDEVSIERNDVEMMTQNQCANDEKHMFKQDSNSKPSRFQLQMQGKDSTSPTPGRHSKKMQTKKPPEDEQSEENDDDDMREQQNPPEMIGRGRVKRRRSDSFNNKDHPINIDSRSQSRKREVEGRGRANEEAKTEESKNGQEVPRNGPSANAPIVNTISANAASQQARPSYIQQSLLRSSYFTQDNIMTTYAENSAFIEIVFHRRFVDSNETAFQATLKRVSSKQRRASQTKKRPQEKTSELMHSQRKRKPLDDDDEDPFE